MHVGISSWTFPWAIGVPGYPLPRRPLAVIGLLDRAKDLGVAVVQLADNLPLHNLNAPELEAIRVKAMQCGITIELGTRGVEPLHLLKYLEIAKILNASLLRTLPESIDPDPKLDLVERKLREVLPQFVENKVSIALENYEGHSVTNLRALMKRIGSPFVGVCLDTVNSRGALEAYARVVSDLAPYVISLHIKDFEIRRVDSMMGFLIAGCPAGEGRLDVDWIVKKVRKHGKNPNMIIELWTPFCETIERTTSIEEEWANRSVRFLMKYQTDEQRVGP
jgi:3-oxoisoapionate decarboxylase